ncbi:MAG: phosphatase PAP2 family protein [Candidatus Altiarchaeota archaeon]|nr:phosphatase PAP2 family protein [Candidatus Altiarchaeota archaeon]
MMNERGKGGGFRYVGALAAASLVIAGIVTYAVDQLWQGVGLVFIASGLAGLLIFYLRERGLFKQPFIQKLDYLLRDRGDESLDIYTKIGVGVYLLALLYVLVRYNLRILPDQVIFLGVFAAALLGKTRKFLSDWLPFVILIFAYDSMRGIADNIGFPVNYLPLIHAEKLLFMGNLPTINLQEMFYTVGVTRWYDVLAMNVYFLHFTPAIIFAGYLWYKKNTLFLEFRDAMVLVSYAALVTFLLCPAAPPWLSHEEGFIQEDLHRIRLEIKTKYLPTAINTIYFLATSNPVAAMPSLHAAYPFLVFLYARKRWGGKGTVFILLPLSIGFSAVYMGEHYVIDLLAGFVYATVAYRIIEGRGAKTKSMELG